MGMSPSDVHAAGPQPLSAHVLRLCPGDDLLLSLGQYCDSHGIHAGFMLTCVGSLNHTIIRLAAQGGETKLEGMREIVSLVGTLSPGSCHLHLVVSDGAGNTMGGHVMEGCIVNTTAEIGIGAMEGVQFERQLDEATGYNELTVRSKD